VAHMLDPSASEPSRPMSPVSSPYSKDEDTVALTRVLTAGTIRSLNDEILFVYLTADRSR